jgi:hypothetical protein
VPRWYTHEVTNKYRDDPRGDKLRLTQLVLGSARFKQKTSSPHELSSGEVLRFAMISRHYGCSNSLCVVAGDVLGRISLNRRSVIPFAGGASAYVRVPDNIVAPLYFSNSGARFKFYL